jgi:hypothetical protein
MENLLTSLLSLTTFIPPLFIFIASCYYLSKSARTDAVLLLTGSGIGLLVTVSLSLMPRFVQSRYMPFTEASQYYAIIGLISFLGGICFAVGFFMLVTNMINAYKQKKHSCYSGRTYSLSNILCLMAAWHVNNNTGTR